MQIRGKMLKHMNSSPSNPARVVVLGAGGFVGGASVRRLEFAGIEVLGLARPDLDLLQDGAAEKLASELRPDDALLVVSAKAPVKDHAMLLDNIAMMKSVSFQSYMEVLPIESNFQLNSQM